MYKSVETEMCGYEKRGKIKKRKYKYLDYLHSSLSIEFVLISQFRKPSRHIIMIDW
jgi:hypothetical protein